MGVYRWTVFTVLLLRINSMLCVGNGPKIIRPQPQRLKAPIFVQFKQAFMQVDWDKILTIHAQLLKNNILILALTMLPRLAAEN